MAADLAELKTMIEEALPGAEVEIVDEGGGDHLRAIVTAPQFEGLSRIDQHRLVKNAVRERFDDGTIHALSVSHRDRPKRPPSPRLRLRGWPGQVELRYPEAMADQELKEKVQELVSEHPVLLFMKGVPEMPRCGFSMRVVGVLDQLGVEYGAIDVLPALQPLREVTTELYDWQTFPQLYVNGELVGGCDIVEEMLETGELAELLGVEQPENAAPPEPERILPGGSQTSPPMQLG